MKIKIFFKTPDAVFYALQDLPEEERETAEAIAKKYVSYGECATIEIDTETGEATVLKALPF
jgi:hypothetical protein